MARNLDPRGGACRPVAAPLSGPFRAGKGPGRPGAAALAAVLALGLAGCAYLPPSPGTLLAAGPAAGWVAAEEPRAAAVGREVLGAGGSAADAAVAAGLALAVTLPSRAGLGGGGACLVHDHRRPGVVEAILFPPGPREAVPAGADRPAAAPMLARGLFLLHAGRGRRPFEALIGPAEDLAREGHAVSRPLAEDLAAVSGPLLADPAARSVFGGVAGAGSPLVQPDLAATLARLRLAGVGDLHQGALARRLAEASGAAGGGLTLEALRDALPRALPAPAEAAGRAALHLPPAEADGGATLAAFRAAAAGAPAPALPGLHPASTALAVRDDDGGAVACAFTMNNLFGTGRVAPGTGMVLASAPGFGPAAPPPLATVLALAPGGRGALHVGAGSGQGAAPAAAAGPAALALLRGAAPRDAVLAGAPEPGRAVMVSCVAGRCAGLADPRGGGAALGR